MGTMQEIKKIITGILARGYTTSKKPLEEITSAFYPMEKLVKTEYGLTKCNNNAFWKPENNRNRLELIADFATAKLGNHKTNYFHIINRYENGDGYGIEKN